MTYYDGSYGVRILSVDKILYPIRFWSYEAKPRTQYQVQHKVTVEVLGIFPHLVLRHKPLREGTILQVNYRSIFGENAVSTDKYCTFQEVMDSVIQYAKEHNIPSYLRTYESWVLGDECPTGP